MAVSPEVSVAVTAVLDGLEAAMSSAQQTVASAAGAMASAPARMGIAQKFDAAMGAAARSARRVQTAIGATDATLQLLQGNLQGAMSALPGAFGLAAGSAFALGRAIREQVTGELAAAKKEAEDLALAMEKSSLKSQARDIDRLAEIMKAGNEEQRIELERRREIALARQELLKLETEGATQEAIALVAAKERLANDKARLALAEIQKARMADMVEAQRKAGEEYEKRRDIEDRANAEISDISKRIGIAGTDDPMRKAALQYEIDLSQIRRQEAEDRKTMGDMLAEQLRMKREELLYAESLRKTDEIRARAADEAARAERDRLQAQRSALQDELGQLKAPGGFTSGVSTSIGGSFRVANLSAAGEQVRYQERTATLAEQIRALVARIDGKLSPESGFA